MIHPWIFEFCPAFEGAAAAVDYAWYGDLWAREQATRPCELSRQAIPTLRKAQIVT